MAFPRKITDKDVLDALLGIWEKTCVHAVPLSLKRFLTTEGPESLHGSTGILIHAIIEEDLVRRAERRGSNGEYCLQWNRDKGAPTLLTARTVLETAREIGRENSRRAYRRKRAGLYGDAKVALGLSIFSTEELVTELRSRGLNDLTI